MKDKILIIIIWILLGLIYLWLKTTHTTSCCIASDKTSLPPSDTIFQIASTPYLYTNQLDTLIFNDTLFNDFIQFVKDEIQAGDTIHITGWRYYNEQDSFNNKNLGLHRAQLMAEHLLDIGFDVTYKLSSVEIKAHVFPGHLYNPNILEIIPQSQTTEHDKIENRQLIYHAYNKTDIINSAYGIQYIKILADRIIISGEHVKITGHIDNNESEANNLTLGLDRANFVANMLLDKGVSSSQLIISSKGKMFPIAPNNDTALINNNRGTSIEIISKK